MTYIRVLKNGVRVADYRYKSNAEKKLKQGLMSFYNAVYPDCKIRLLVL